MSDIEKLKQITNSKKFRFLYDRFKNCKNKSNYNKLIKILRKIDNYLGKEIKECSTLLTDSQGCPIFNSIYDDFLPLVKSSTIYNSFENYRNGTIGFEDIFQCKCSSMSDKKGSARCKGTINGNTMVYVSIKIGSSYTLGSVENSLGCPPDKCPDLLKKGSCWDCE